MSREWVAQINRHRTTVASHDFEMVTPSRYSLQIVITPRGLLLALVGAALLCGLYTLRELELEDVVRRSNELRLRLLGGGGGGGPHYNRGRSWQPDLRSLPADDARQLANLTDFEYLLDSPPCGARPPTIVAVVHTAPDHTRQRGAIRSTWASPHDHVRVLFLLGAVNSAERQAEIEREHATHGDIVQGNFVDSYHNLTLKHLMALKWPLYNCPGADFVLKVDDDTFVNVPRVLRYLRGFADTRVAESSIVCHVYRVNAAVRNNASKWYVSPDEYADEYYPPHCSGFAIAYPMRVALKLYAAAQRAPYLWVDDAYVSGVLARRANVSHHEFGVQHGILCVDLEAMIDDGRVRYAPSDNVVGASAEFQRGFLFGPVNMSPGLIEKLWGWSRGKDEVYLRGFIGSRIVDSSIVCHLFMNNPVLRDNSSKWYVSPDDFAEDHYPMHCSGFAIAYPMRVAFKLYAAAQRVPYLWVDDAYVSGVLARRANVTHHEFGKQHNVDRAEVARLVDHDRYQPGDNQVGEWAEFKRGFIFGPVNMGPELVEKLYKWTLTIDDV